MLDPSHATVPGSYARTISETKFTEADISYVRANYFTLDELSSGRSETPGEVRALIAQGLLPAPSYVLDDGTQMLPADYFVLIDQAGGPEQLRQEFERRHRAAGGDPVELEADWKGYIEGVYGVCLRQVLPETIIRKSQLVVSLERLLEVPAREDSGWRSQLRREVWELDALEREFAPDYDRGGRVDRPPTRDRLIATTRERYPDVFTAELAVA